MELRYTPIGRVESPHARPEGAPIQPSGARGVRGRIVIEPSLAEGLKDLEGFSHLIVIYHCHLSGPASLLVRPFLGGEKAEPKGVFATRAPSRPNSIGLSVLRIVGVEGNVIEIEDVDILNDTPVLDVKPYVPAFDRVDDVRAGWLESRAGDAAGVRADGRFAAETEGGGA